jgi:hypothetical protein
MTGGLWRDFIRDSLVWHWTQLLALANTSAERRKRKIKEDKTATILIVPPRLIFIDFVAKGTRDVNPNERPRHTRCGKYDLERWHRHKGKTKALFMTPVGALITTGSRIID